MKRNFLEMVIANSVKTSIPNYLIADIALSDFGRKEIKIAETEILRQLHLGINTILRNHSKEQKSLEVFI